MYGFKRVETPRLPQDMSMHTKRGAMKTMRFIRRLYMPNIIVTDGSLEPADLIVVGPRGGGPGHAMIVGEERNHLWHSYATGVHWTGLGFPGEIFRVYRLLDRHLW